jgi:hypothetical protein
LPALLARLVRCGGGGPWIRSWAAATHTFEGLTILMTSR